ncbi:hypothetical protein CR152_15155 [Massilia violaceinigra]|uniref:Tox-PAAR-like domain-containing protein n=1 Tax=Massilia violaceinigra TaxID=2045208 RepID=A0A2D2DL56_9BURK|nr:hypothetical protein [Massilia violaceinigra]ATQ75717.1 hypothetical protein CR152_15155 [Massilia violaceinigra]
MMGLVRHIAHADGWLVVATEPDLCQVGKCVVAFNSFAQLDYKHAASPDVKARGTPVYRIGDLFKNTQANAGAHIVSGTSLSTGYVQILEGHSNVKVNGIPVARHDSGCRINCDSAGMGGARGQVVTMVKTVAPPAAKSAAIPASAAARVSKKLLALKTMRDKLLAGRLDFDALDEFFNFDRANAVSDGWIGEIQGTPGTVGDWAAQGARGVLGGVKGFVMGTGELAYEVVKGVPKLLRMGGTEQGQQLAMLDKLILIEDIRLGNVSATSVAQDASGLASAMVSPVTNPWSKGQYVESVTRGVFEAAMFGSGWLKAARAAKAKKLLDLAKVKDASATAGTAAATTATTGTTTAGSAAVSTATGAATGAGTAAVGGSAAKVGTIASTKAIPTGRGGVYVSGAPKRARPPPNGYSGPDAYKTHGIVDSPLNSAEGRRLVESYTSQGFTPVEAAEKAANLMASGSSLPKTIDLVAGDALYKLVPEGDIPGKYSAFFATKDEISALKGMSYDQISDRLGIPLESQQTLRFDVHEVTANRAITVFESTIARTSQNGYLQPGGGIQTLITDRSAFTSPVLIGKLP